jgi:multiple sugar transport system permease protein
MLFAFIVPAIAYLTVFCAFPLFYGISISFEQFGFAQVVSGHGPFVGFGNYSAILWSGPNAGYTHTAIENTVAFLVLSIVFQYSIGLGLAQFFNRRFALSRFLRALIILPWLFPPIANGTVFSIIFSGQSGLANSILTDLHIIHSPIYWLDRPLSGMFVIILVNIWAGIPFNTLLLYSGLQDVPKELNEAAELDGANVWERFRFITMPILKPVSLIVLLLGIVYTVKVFDIVLVLTSGGPDNGTQVMSLWSWDLAFSVFNFGQGAAVADILLVFCMIMGVFYIRLSRSEAGLR